MTLTIYSKTFGPRHVLFDDEDAPIVMAHKWHIVSRRYAATMVNGKIVMMHRLLLNPRPEQVVDHRNHNMLDNRRANIWACTQKDNQANRLDNKNSKTGIRGVHPFRDKYRVQVGTRYVGVFSTLDEATAARAAAILTPSLLSK